MTSIPTAWPRWTPSRLSLATLDARRQALSERARGLDQSRPPRIVLAEDDLEMRRFIASALAKDGYDLVEARSGDELFDLLMTQLRNPSLAQPVALIISDLRMPGLTGLQVLAELRASDWATPFILITAFGGEETRDRAVRQGAAAVFDKPFDIDDLRTAVVNLLGRPASPGKPAH
jgi:DNA-binding response OmpR family regulator